MISHPSSNRHLRLVYSSSDYSSYRDSHNLKSDLWKKRNKFADDITKELSDIFNGHVKRISNNLEAHAEWKIENYNTRWDVSIKYHGPNGFVYDENGPYIILTYDWSRNIFWSYRVGGKGENKIDYGLDTNNLSSIHFHWDMIDRSIRHLIEDAEAEYARMRQANLNPRTISKDLKKMLNEHGVPTSPKCHYELVWRSSESRGRRGARHTITFTADGDWLACFGMRYKGSPTARKFFDDFGYDLFEEMEDYAVRYPTVEKLLRGIGWVLAEPDEYTMVDTLTNLDTGEVIYPVND